MKKTFLKLSLFFSLLLGFQACLETEDELISKESALKQELDTRQTKELSGTKTASFLIETLIPEEDNGSELGQITLELTVSEPTTINVSWGDGSIETITSEQSMDYEEELLYLHHEFKNFENQKYNIKISGQLNNIIGFETIGFEAYRMVAVNFGNLSNLEFLKIGTGFSGILGGPKVVNLSGNSKLRGVAIQAEGFEYLHLPAQSKITSVDLASSLDITVESVNNAIKKAYSSAVKFNIRGGDFDYRKDWWDNEGEDPNNKIVTPSPEAMNMLKKLRDNYGWDIKPQIPAEKNFQIEVFMVDDSGYTGYADGVVAVITDPETGEKVRKELNDVVSTINLPFINDPNKIYKLSLFSNYPYWEREFSYNELMKELNGESLKVVLPFQ